MFYLLLKFTIESQQLNVILILFYSGGNNIYRTISEIHKVYTENKRNVRICRAKHEEKSTFSSSIFKMQFRNIRSSYLISMDSIFFPSLA